MQNDPLGLAAGDDNLYRYAGDNPANNLDPSGEKILIDQAYVVTFTKAYDKVLRSDDKALERVLPLIISEIEKRGKADFEKNIGRYGRKKDQIEAKWAIEEYGRLHAELVGRFKRILARVTQGYRASFDGASLKERTHEYASVVTDDKGRWWGRRISFTKLHFAQEGRTQAERLGTMVHEIAHGELGGDHFRNDPGTPADNERAETWRGDPRTALKDVHFYQAFLRGGDPPRDVERQLDLLKRAIIYSKDRELLMRFRDLGKGALWMDLDRGRR
jgi:hypothetical protein